MEHNRLNKSFPGESLKWGILLLGFKKTQRTDLCFMFFKFHDVIQIGAYMSTTTWTKDLDAELETSSASSFSMVNS